MHTNPTLSHSKKKKTRCCSCMLTLIHNIFDLYVRFSLYQKIGFNQGFPMKMCLNLKNLQIGIGLKIRVCVLGSSRVNRFCQPELLALFIRCVFIVANCFRSNRSPLQHGVIASSLLSFTCNRPQKFASFCYPPRICYVRL